MSVAARPTLDHFLSLRYEFHVIPDPDGGPDYAVMFPDLPGCMTQVQSLDEVVSMAEDVRRLWLVSTYEQGLEIPLPGSGGTGRGR